jgi:hypothetical protein
MRKVAPILLLVIALSAAPVTSAQARPFTPAASFTAESSFTAGPADLSLPGYLQFVTLCGSLVGAWED